MKALSLALIASLSLTACGGLGSADIHASEEAITMTAEQEQERALKFMMPGEGHAELAKSVGKWDVVTKMWFEADSEPMEMRTESEFTMLMGDRFLREEISGTFMGMPYEGELTLGINSVTGEYWGLWIDNMGTSYGDSRGFMDADGAVHMRGITRDSVAPEGRPYRLIQWPTAADGSRKFEMFNTQPDGTEMRSIEMIYTRQMKQ